MKNASEKALGKTLIKSKKQALKELAEEMKKNIAKKYRAEIVAKK